MPSKCINIECTSSSQEQLKPALWSACSYYRVCHKPNLRVCATCLKKCEEYYCLLVNCMRKQLCVLDVSTERRPEFIDLVDDDDNSIVSSPFIETTQENQLLVHNMSNIALSHLKPLIDKQLEMCQNRVIETTKKAEAVKQRVLNKFKDLDNALFELHKNLY